MNTIRWDIFNDLNNRSNTNTRSLHPLPLTPPSHTHTSIQLDRNVIVDNVKDFD